MVEEPFETEAEQRAYFQKYGIEAYRYRRLYEQSKRETRMVEDFYLRLIRCHPHYDLVNDILARSMTKLGQKAWWDRPHPSLNGDMPRQAWASGQRALVVDAALTGMGMIAT